MSMSVLTACMYMYDMYAWCPQRSKCVFESLEMEVVRHHVDAEN